MFIAIILACTVFSTDAKPALEGVTPRPIMMVPDMPADKLAVGPIYDNFKAAFLDTYMRRLAIVEIGGQKMTPNKTMKKEISQEAFRLVVADCFKDISFRNYLEMVDKPDDPRWRKVDQISPELATKIGLNINKMVLRNIDRYYDKVK